MQLASVFLIGGFEYCMNRNPYYSINDVHLIGDNDVIRQTDKLKPPPNIPRIQYFTYVQLAIYYTYAYSKFQSVSLFCYNK